MTETETLYELKRTLLEKAINCNITSIDNKNMPGLVDIPSVAYNIGISFYLLFLEFQYSTHRLLPVCGAERNIEIQ